jgi:acetyltransferase-like isoleucine patch superfamily enzyme
MMFHKIIYRLFVNWIVRVFYPLSAFNYIKMTLLRTLGAQIGNSCFIHQNVFISGHTHLKIGRSCVLSRGVTLVATGGLEIGDNVLIGYDTKILTRNHNIPDEVGLPIRWAGHINKPVIIEADAWLACNVVIVPGVTIGKGTVVAAGAVVTSNTEPYGVYAGVPARKIRSRIKPQSA